MPKQLEILRQHIAQKGLNQSAKRERVLGIFLETKGHITARELFDQVSRRHPDIGYTTVYRTLKMFVEAGLAVEVDFNDGVKRYERKLGRDFHAHLICTRCGRGFELFDGQIRDVSVFLARQKNFSLQTMRFELFGLCRACAAAAGDLNPREKVPQTEMT
jgi:Fur family ferric uptake transcriptional regulator